MPAEMMEPQDECTEEGNKNTTDDPPWFLDSKYDRYWTHYHQMREWMQAQQPLQTFASNSMASSWMQSYHHYYLQYQWWMYHHLSSNSSTHYHPSTSYWSSQYHPHSAQGMQMCSDHPVRTPHRDHYHHHHPYKLHAGLNAYRGNKPYVTDQSDVDYLDNGFSETQPEDEEEGDILCGHKEDEEFEVELSEEMRQFFLQSQKHRQELKEMRLAFSKKKEQEEAEKRDNRAEIAVKSSEELEDEFVTTSFSSSKKSKKKQIAGAPKEQPGKRRAEEMKVLYGKDSPAIHGMETAIQMQFDRNCDKKQPAFWPTVPLKM